MYPTAEVRWFLEGPLPESGLPWFHDLAGNHFWETRTDHYVRPPSPDGLGVKGRTGNLEVKRLARVAGVEVWGDVAGRLEHWRKWSFPLDAAAGLRNPGSDWVAVAKRRLKGNFEIAEGCVVRAEHGMRRPGCSLELAEVGAEGRVCWSVSLEAFGTYDETALEAILRRTAGFLFAEAPPFALPAERSLSYPAWLWRLRRADATPEGGRAAVG